MYDQIKFDQVGTAKQTDQDAVWGVKDIAVIVNRTPRQTYRLLETGRLPAKKKGRIWQSTRSALLRDLEPEKA